VRQHATEKGWHAFVTSTMKRKSDATIAGAATSPPIRRAAYVL
jgi:hypothetical protein